MKALLLTLLVLVGCSSPHEGQRINVAGIEFEGMAWRVECGKTTAHDLHERWEYESPNYCDAKLHEQDIMAYSLCPEWMRVRYRYEWAKAELRACGGVQ